MKRITLPRELMPRYLLAIVAGLALALAFPEFNAAGLAWVAPGILLFAAAGCSGGAAFRVGFVGGLAFNLAALHWLLFIPVRFSPILGWLALSAYLALYPALWVWLCWKLFPGVPATKPGVGRLAAARATWVSTTYLQRLLWSLLCAASWVALEIVMGRLLTGFPWLLLGASQQRLTPLIQILSVTGIYGLSFTVAWFAVSLGFAGLALVEQPARRGLAIREIAPPLLLAASLMAFGLERIASAKPATGTMKITLVQPSIPQTVIWNPRESTNRFQKLLQLSESALEGKPDLLVWPEAGVPNLLRYDERVLGAVTNLARRHGAWLIAGAEDAKPRHTGGTNEADYFNSAFLISPEGRLVEKYDKRRLVIFGEYIPLVRWLPFLKWFTPVEGGFTPGARPVAFGLNIPRLKRTFKASVIICFEDSFPHGVRGHLEDSPDFLLNLTNDGWFGAGAQQWQHAANAAFRAVESGLPIVRCCNNGITGWADERGRWREVFTDSSGSAYGAGFIDIHFPVHSPASDASRTFYTRHGDVFGWGCAAIVSITIARHLRRRQSALESLSAKNETPPSN